MAKFTLVQKADHYNSLLKSTALNKLKLNPVDKFKSHKEADEHGKALFETINKQKGYSAGIADSGLIEIVKEKVEDETAKPEAKKRKVTEAKINDDAETVKLIETVIKAEEYAGAKWYQTGEWIYRFKAQFGTDAKKNREVAYGLLDSNSAGAVPEKGLNNDGKEIVLRTKSTGKVKWAAWDKTRRWTQNIADIFKAVEVSGFDAVFPGGKLVTRPEVTELGKKASTPELPVKTIERSIDMVLKKLDECPADKETKEKIEAMMQELNLAYAEWK